MLCNPTSYFPEEIDKQLFFEDITIDNVDILNNFQNLIKQKKYTEASEYIKGADKVTYGVFADFLNAYENRLYKLQDHLKDQNKTNPHFFNELYIVPANIQVGEYWLNAGKPIDKFVLNPVEYTKIDERDPKSMKITDPNSSYDYNNKTLKLVCSNDEYIAIQQYD